MRHMELQLQVGKKGISEIERLIDTNCWKALFWLHVLILKQLHILFIINCNRDFIFKANSVKDIKFDEETILLNNVSMNEIKDYKNKLDIVDKNLRYMGPAIQICYACSLIDGEYSDLKKFNKFRNEELAHHNIHYYLPEDSEVKNICKLGLKIIKKLDESISFFCK